MTVDTHLVILALVGLGWPPVGTTPRLVTESRQDRLEAGLYFRAGPLPSILGPRDGSPLARHGCCVSSSEMHMGVASSLVHRWFGLLASCRATRPPN